MTGLNKRYSAKHKAALGKVDSHLRMAKANHSKGMECLSKAAMCMVDAKKVSKAVDDDEMARHLAGAHGFFGKAADNMMDMEAHLNQALTQFKPDEMPLMVPRGYSRSNSNRNEPEPSLAGAVTPSLDDMTEGPVGQFSSYLPYPSGEKIAASAAFAKMFTGQAPGRHVIRKSPMWANPRWR